MDNNSINFEQIIKDNTTQQGSTTALFLRSEMLKCMKEAVRQAVPLILEDAAENASTKLHEEVLGIGDWSYDEIDKSSITNRKEEIIKKLEL